MTIIKEVQKLIKLRCGLNNMNISQIFKRKKVVVDPKLQFGIVSVFMGITMVNISFFMISIYFFQKNIMVDTLSLDENTQKTIFSLFFHESEKLVNKTIIFSILSLSFSSILGVVLLNRVAGPIYLIKRFLEEMLKEDFSRAPIKLRNSDFFSEIGDLINQLALKYKAKENSPK